MSNTIQVDKGVKKPPVVMNAFTGVQADNLKINHWNQFNALFRKSATYQWRQYKTNLCQVLFPLVLVALLYWFQTLITSFVQSQASIDPSPNPPAFPNTLLTTNLSLATDCPGSLTTELAPGTFSYVDLTGTTNPNITLDFLESGIFGPATTFQGSTDLTRGGLVTICRTKILLQTPITWDQFSSLQELDATYYAAHAQSPDLQGGIILNQLNTSDQKLDASLFYNFTLTSGTDLPYWIDLIGMAFVNSLSPNGTLMISGGTKNFPYPGFTLDFDLISFIGPFFYIFIFQLTFPVILGGMVYEKEQKLKEIMIMMGLNMNTYWVVTYIFSYLLYLATFFILWIACWYNIYIYFRRVSHFHDRALTEFCLDHLDSIQNIFCGSF